ncbi:lysophospholipid acyltransferase family protein [Clostridium taeniosporum]|uniref:1-acyl-sn-glycerol-3-phosphate acyltransferase n=1 Tax=Clostridium taeniosporum TaxID=394958 RepID=A0A1D7XMM5_9CLOT|nr:lysophospholipid acyltransferase family protein [Clostridium taeniosporum]AOR24430.1 1-acyl-sn-glycerol-3-phosphate acyltransferase [Clostridium taeniosporum]
MLSPTIAKILELLPESLFVKFGKMKVSGYIKKYANITLTGIENIDKVKKPRIFICNHLSNADGLVLDKILKEKSDPYFIAGAKLSDDIITRIGTKIVKNIPIKPNSADKDAITSIIKTLRSGEDVLIFPEGTRSRTGAMIEGKKGILLMARMSKAEIVPIGMCGTEKLLPISKTGDMGAEKWHKANVYINIGKNIELPKKNKDEDKHEYDDRCLHILMKSIANLLPEEYRGVYK